MAELLNLVLFFCLDVDVQRLCLSRKTVLLRRGQELPNRPKHTFPQ